MLEISNNPYAAPQSVPRQESNLLLRCLKRGAIGLLVGVVVFQVMVQFSWHLESGVERYRGMMYCSYCVLVAGTSVFTQSDPARAEGRTGIISACLIFLVALIAGAVLSRLLGIIPYPMRRSDSLTLEKSAQLLGIVYLLDLFFVFIYFCRRSRLRNAQRHNS
jgi:cytochrome bd-type quinol oxidase subunit 2